MLEASPPLLRRELESMDLVDQMQNLKTYDYNGVVVVKILCGECKREIEGTGVITTNLQ